MSSSQEPSINGQNRALSGMPLSNRKRAWSEDSVGSSFSGSAKQQKNAVNKTIHHQSAINDNTFGPGARIHQGNVIYNAGNSSHEASAQDCRRKLFLTDPAEDRKALKRKKGDRASGTCEWLLETDEFTAWLGREQTTGEAQASNILWLHGNPGTGKSTMAIFLTEELPKRFFVEDGETLLYFFCDSSFEQRKTATSIIRGLLYQLIQQHSQLLDYLLPKFNDRGAELFRSFDALWAIFIAAAADRDTGQKYCIVDALDECDLESQKILLRQLQETFQNQEAPSNIRFLVTSRPYSEICEYLEEFLNKDIASFPQAKQDINQCIKERVSHLAKKKKYTEKVKKQVSDILRAKAEGTFLWVGLACEELEDIPSKNAIQILQKMPKGLPSLYKRLLDTTLEQEDSGADMVRRVLSLVAVCKRPLSVLELSEACQIYQEEVDIETRIQFTRDQIASCRLLIIIQDEKVLLLHQSVKDYLVGADSSHFMSELDAHASVAYRCVNFLIEQFHSKEQPNTHFLSYAAQQWPNHARMAQSRFEVGDSEAEFFRVNSPSREYWLDILRKDGGRIYYQISEQFSISHIAGRWGIASLIDYVATQNYQQPNIQTLMPAINCDCLDEDDRTPMAYAVDWGHIGVITKLLCLGAKVNERIVTSAAKNARHGMEMIRLFLDHRGDQIIITEGIVEAAVENENGKEMMTLLFDERGDQIIITEDIVKAAAENENGKEIMALLLDRRGDQVTITENIVKAAAENRNGKEIMALLLDRRGDQVTITENIVNAAAENRNGKEIMALLLDRRGDQVTITENIVRAAAENGNGKEIMALLLDRRGDQVTITENIVKAAAKNRNSKEIMALLLDRLGEQIHITDDIIEAAANNAWKGKEIMTLLLYQRGNQAIITENIIKAAARNSDSEELMALLLDRLGDEVHITEDIVSAAAGNRRKGKEIITLLLNKGGDKITITENVVKAAARNVHNGEIMALLLDRFGEQFHITEDIVKAAARNTYTEEIMALLLDQPGEQFHITEDIIKTAAENMWKGKEILSLLLDKRGDQITISEEVIKTAAGNWKEGEGIMALLLDRREHKIIVTEEVMKTVAANRSSGKRMMTLLLNRQGDRQIAITEEVVKVAATCGHDAVLNVLSRQSNVDISNWDKWHDISKFLKAARTGNIHCIKQLIHEGVNPDMKNTRGETPLWHAASNGHEAVVEVLAQRPDVNPDIKNARGETPLWRAATNGHEAVVEVLARRPDVNVNSLSADGQSPLFWPSSRGYERIVAILMEAGADPHFVAKGGYTAITNAKERGHDRIVKMLERRA
ncbi:hypothetical protein HDV63DRAFT_265294 [Trichoderma sp. SZMC 28014]